MLFSILERSFLNQKRAMAVMVVSVAVGTSIAASLLSLSLDISSKVSKELRSFGANIVGYILKQSMIRIDSGFFPG